MDTIALIDRMQETGFIPNHITFTNLLSSYSHTGLVDEGWKFVYCMISDHHQSRPTLEHYIRMVDLLGRARRLDESHEFIKNMSIEPNAYMYNVTDGCFFVYVQCYGWLFVVYV